MDNMGKGRVLTSNGPEKISFVPKVCWELGTNYGGRWFYQFVYSILASETGLMSMGLIPTHQDHIALGHGVVYLVVCGGLLDSCVFFYTRGFDRS